MTAKTTWGAGTGGPTPGAERAWTIAQLVELWGLSDRTIRRELASGRLACFRGGPSGRRVCIPDWARRRYEAERLRAGPAPDTGGR